ncbi:unnamed protein product [Blepharisma stoltei]|uniref:Uncharacterized protein n=1 Tax=Blepharisma stoltei TaxID=1481888 RepID=A0AAU9IKE6_9CILI|nr:unnamed protein product [Blepharisma stoltei]
MLFKALKQHLSRYQYSRKDCQLWLKSPWTIGKSGCKGSRLSWLILTRCKLSLIRNPSVGCASNMLTILLSWESTTQNLRIALSVLFWMLIIGLGYMGRLHQFIQLCVSLHWKLSKFQLFEASLKNII